MLSPLHVFFYYVITHACYPPRHDITHVCNHLCMLPPMHVIIMYAIIYACYHPCMYNHVCNHPCMLSPMHVSSCCYHPCMLSPIHVIIVLLSSMHVVTHACIIMYAIIYACYHPCILSPMQYKSFGVKVLTMFIILWEFPVSFSFPYVSR